MDKKRLSQAELQKMFYSGLTPNRLAQILKEKVHNAIGQEISQLDEQIKTVIPPEDYCPDKFKQVVEELNSVYRTSFNKAITTTFEEINTIAAVPETFSLANLELPSEAEQHELIMQVEKAREELVSARRFNAELEFELEQYKLLEPVINHAKYLLEMQDEVEKHELTKELKTQLQEAIKGKGKDIYKHIPKQP